MPRYFFNTVDGGKDFDKQGEELADDAAARAEAIRYLGAILHDGPVSMDSGEFMVEVKDESGRLVCRLITRDEGAGGG